MRQRLPCAWKFTLPGWHNHDLSFFKDIRLKGSQQLQFRLEIYNLFNQVSFQDVNNDGDVRPEYGRADRHELRQGDGGSQRASYADVATLHLLTQ